MEMILELNECFGRKIRKPQHTDWCITRLYIYITSISHMRNKGFRCVTSHQMSHALGWEWMGAHRECNSNKESGWWWQNWSFYCNKSNSRVFPYTCIIDWMNFNFYGTKNGCKYIRWNQHLRLRETSKWWCVGSYLSSYISLFQICVK